MQPPEIIKPTKLADYLEVISKAVFESGMRWSVVEAKWDGFRDAFHGFDPEYIANLSPADVDALANDTRIIRNRRKIEATIHNANAILALDKRHGGFASYLASFPNFESTSASLRQEFKHFGAFGTYYFLYVVGQPVPPHEEFRSKLAALK